MIYDTVLFMFVSESVRITDDICSFCGFFGSAPYCSQVLTDLFETVQDASKTVDLKGRAPNGTDFLYFVDTNKANTGVRWVHITTRFETSENRPRPKKINTERDESSQTHLTVFTTLRSFRDKYM